MLKSITNAFKTLFGQNKNYGDAPMMEKVDMLKFQPRYFAELRQNNRDLTARLSEIKSRAERNQQNALEFRRIQDERMDNTREVIRAAKVNVIQVAAVVGLNRVKGMFDKLNSWQDQLANHRHGQTYDFYNEMWDLVSFRSWTEVTKDVDANRLWYMHQTMDDDVADLTRLAGFGEFLAKDCKLG